ncbi:MAG: ribosomal protein S18-alanine N-acetyltransferase [Gemmatimonadales bacterium]
MGDRYRIRPATETDLEVMARIERECFSDPWSKQTLRSMIRRSGALVATRGPTLVGYLFEHSAGEEGEILNVAVDRAHRRCGVGRALIGSALESMRGRGVRSAFLEVRQSNRGAQAFYHGLGFRQVGKRPRYYRNPPEDALIFAIDLTPELDSRGNGQSGVSLVDKRT